MRQLLLALLLPTLVAGGIPSVSLQSPRAAHTATLLPSGQVLVVGGCAVDSCELDARGATSEIYDATARRFRAGPSLSAPRVGHVAALLPGGDVLVAGGWSTSGLVRTAEVYDGSTFVPTGLLGTARGGASATRLRDGRVLVVGGSAVGGKVLASAEVYDPRARKFSSTGPLRTARGGHVAVALRDGRVLVVGGSDGNGVLASTELYEPRSGRFVEGPRLRTARHKHAAVVMQDGRVLVLGGSNERDFSGRYASAELLDVRRPIALRAPPMQNRRFKLPDAAVLLADGSVLVAGGSRELERFDTTRRRFVPAGRIDVSLAFATATRLRNGDVLVVGGYDERLRVSRRAWLAPTD